MEKTLDMEEKGYVIDVDIRGWLDATLEPTNWMKHIRCTTSSTEANVQHFLKDGHLWYEVICDISPGRELLLRPKVPLHPRDGQDERGSERGSGNGFYVGAINHPSHIEQIDRNSVCHHSCGTRCEALTLTDTSDDS
uniref:SET domain-containing protein n=1 Tax=Anopheles culicifacies TaxID=139723 RepID=A0A182LSC3_9DIPT